MDEIDVQMHDGARRDATLVAGDPLTDIAVLEFQADRTIAATRSDVAAHQGDLVFAFGSPLDFRFSVSSGVVSGLGRDTRDASVRSHGGFENFIQIDAPINPGSSGGPVTDHRGHVIGMSTAIAADVHTTTEDRFSGVALAVPMTMIEAVVPQLLSEGQVRRGYLGVSILDTHRPVTAMIGPVPMPGGVLLSQVHPGSNLDSAGLRAGDLIWTIDGEPATLELMEGWLRSGVGALSATHLLDGNPLEPREISAPPSPAGEATVVSLSSPLHRVLAGAGSPPAGVIVSTPVAGGPADLAGLRRGDVITSIDERPTRSVDQLRAIVSSLPPGTTVTVSLWRPDLTRGAGLALDVDITLADRSERFDP
jgi:S1-C subfamily serine protease